METSPNREQVRVSAIRFMLAESNPDALYLDAAYDAALIGICERHTFPALAAYDMAVLKSLLDNSDSLVERLISSYRGDQVANSPVFVRGIGSDFNTLVSEVNSVVAYDGFENQVVGIVERFGWPEILIYDGGGCTAHLAEQGMAWYDAQEFFDYNVSYAWVGESTPAFLYAPLDGDYNTFLAEDALAAEGV